MAAAAKKSTAEKKPAAKSPAKAEAKPAAKKSTAEKKPAAKSPAKAAPKAEANGKATPTKAKSPKKDPEGGLTQAGRDAEKAKTGANLKPGVMSVETPDDMKRKGSWLRRHYATLSGPLVGEDGKPTRLALQAKKWGEKVPKTEEDAAKLAAKGERLLTKYQKDRDAEKAEKKATAQADKAKAKADKEKAAEAK